MERFRNISAVLFDMDGTLVDSELLTEPVIRSLCREMGVHDPMFEWPGFYGVSWNQVAGQVAAAYPASLTVPKMSQRLNELYVKACAENPPMPVPGAREAVVAAHARMPTAIVSSSNSGSIDKTIRQMQLEDFVTYRAGADNYPKSKPAPDGYLHAATVLGVDPEACLVFEDSLAGIQSAKAAGMAVIAVTHRSNVEASAHEITDAAIRDFLSLENGFFDRIGQ